jgi:hypothetical protein
VARPHGLRSEVKHIASPAQLNANVANAQKSTGPKTEKGKHRTRLNAYRHGLTGQICLLTADEHEAFDQHCSGIRESLEPVGALETELAQSIAEDHWRLKRARAIETGISPPACSVNSATLSEELEKTPPRFPLTKRYRKPTPGSPKATTQGHPPTGARRGKLRPIFRAPASAA